MLLRRFFEPQLAQASYLIGCQATGEAIVVDPLRDADLYLRAAEAEDLSIRRVTETHIHADFLSGSRELARRTGATLLLSGEGPEDWRYRLAKSDGVELLHDGDEFAVGRVRLRALHTPGHTPEHLSFFVTDGAASDEPLGLLSGDFLFVGDVGRPDLLEKAAGVRDTMEDGARALWASLQRLTDVPDYLQILPGHGAGSACGKALGAVPTSTLGYERRVGWAFRCADEAEFTEQVLADQPEPPTYFARMKVLNRDGPPLIDGLPVPPRLPAQRLEAGTGEPDPAEAPLLVDLRDRDAFADAHLPGSLHLPCDRSFLTWAGWLLPPDRPLHLVAASPGQAEQAARLLALIGLDRVDGWFDAALVENGVDGGGLRRGEVVEWDEAEARLTADEVSLVDVRRRAEFTEGHVPGARHIHLGHLSAAFPRLSRGRPVMVYCRSGRRSAIAASLLEADGFQAVDVAGGMLERVRRRLPVETGS